MEQKKKQQYSKLLELLKSKNSWEKNKGLSILIPFFERCNRILTVEEKEELFKYLLKDFELLDEYAYKFDFTKEEKSKIKNKFYKKPLFVLKYEKLSNKIFTRKEIETFISMNQRQIIEAGISSVKSFRYLIRDNLTKDTMEHLTDIMYSGEKNVPNTVLNKVIRDIETGQIVTSQDNYDKLVSLKVMKELFK